MNKEELKNKILEELNKNNKSVLLTESSLSRVKDKIENQNIPFAMLTAYRGVDKEATEPEQQEQRAQNNRNQEELKKLVKAAGFPWVDIGAKRL